MFPAEQNKLFSIFANLANAKPPARRPMSPSKRAVLGLLNSSIMQREKSPRRTLSPTKKALLRLLSTQNEAPRRAVEVLIRSKPECFLLLPPIRKLNRAADNSSIHNTFLLVNHHHEHLNAFLGRSLSSVSEAIEFSKPLTKMEIRFLNTLPAFRRLIHACCETYVLKCRGLVDTIWPHMQSNEDERLIQVLRTYKFVLMNTFQRYQDVMDRFIVRRILRPGINPDTLESSAEGKQPSAHLFYQLLGPCAAGQYLKYCMILLQQLLGEASVSRRASNTTEKYNTPKQLFNAITTMYRPKKEELVLSLVDSDSDSLESDNLSINSDDSSVYTRSMKTLEGMAYSDSDQEEEEEEEEEEEVVELPKRVVVYTRPRCPFCTKVKAALRKAGIVDFNVIQIHKSAKKRKEMIRRSKGKKTVPQVFMDGKHIGGYSQTAAFLKRNFSAKKSKPKSAKKSKPKSAKQMFKFF